MSITSEDTKLSNPTVYRDLSRTIIRQWIRIVNPYEFTLLMFIFDRTIGWGKNWEGITWNHFMNGVRSDDGECYNEGTGMPRATLAKMLKSLQARGFIETRPGPSGTVRYALAFSRAPRTDDMFRTSTKKFTDDSSEAGPRLRTPKAKGVAARVNCDDDTEVPAIQRTTSIWGRGSTTETLKSTTETRGSISGTLRDSEIKEVSPKKETDVKPNPADSATVLSEILKKSDLNAQGRIAGILANDNASKEDLAHLYHMTWLAFFPNAPYVMPKEKDMSALRSYAIRFRKNPANKLPFAQFLRWTLECWHMVVRQNFSWMANMPELPNVFFLVKHSTDFEDSFSHREELKARANMSSRDRKIHDLVRKGMDVKLAILEVDEETKAKAPPPRLQPRYAPMRQVAPAYVPPPKTVFVDPATIDWDKFKL